MLSYLGLFCHFTKEKNGSKFSQIVSISLTERFPFFYGFQKQCPIHYSERVKTISRDRSNFLLLQPLTVLIIPSEIQPHLCSNTMQQTVQNLLMYTPILNIKEPFQQSSEQAFRQGYITTSQVDFLYAIHWWGVMKAVGSPHPNHTCHFQLILSSQKRVVQYKTRYAFCFLLWLLCSALEVGSLLVFTLNILVIQGSMSV